MEWLYCITIRVKIGKIMCDFEKNDDRGKIT